MNYTKKAGNQTVSLDESPIVCAGENEIRFLSPAWAVRLFHGVHEQHYITHVMAFASHVGPCMRHAGDQENITDSLKRQERNKNLYTYSDAVENTY